MQNTSSCGGCFAKDAKCSSKHAMFPQAAAFSLHDSCADLRLAGEVRADSLQCKHRFKSSISTIFAELVQKDVFRVYLLGQTLHSKPLAF